MTLKQSQKTRENNWMRKKLPINNITLDDLEEKFKDEKKKRKMNSKKWKT